jgi:predicted HTH domain antitoxin
MLVKFEMSLPEKVLKALGLRESEAESGFKKEMAVYFFQRNLLSFGQARQLSGLSIWNFLELLRERKVPIHYDLREYEEDLKTIQELS